MSTIHICVQHYGKLLELLEEDLEDIRQGLQGDLLDAYEAVVKKEIFEVKNHLDTLRRVANE